MKNKNINVLVTGVGAIIGYGIIKSLRNSKYSCNIIGIDIFSDAVGQKWCNKFIQGVKADSNEFIGFINDIIANEKIDLVIPGIEQDLKSIVENFSELDQSAKFTLNNKNLFETFYNKDKTYNFLSTTIKLIPHICYSSALYEESVIRFGLPFILKQNISYASKGVAVIENRSDFNYYIEKFDKNCMSQQKLDVLDSEFTCSVFGTGNGKFVNPICLKRKLSAEGATSKASNIIIDDILMTTLIDVSKKCMFEGPTNLQFIKVDNHYLLLEINARISSSSSIREIFGVNESEMCIEYFLFNKLPESREQKYGTVIRYIEDVYFDSNNI